MMSPDDERVSGRGFFGVGRRRLGAAGAVVLLVGGGACSGDDDDDAGSGGSRGSSALVTKVIDGDTVELGNGEVVRLVGIDTPERGECGYAEATDDLADLVEGKQVRLTRVGENVDRYDRLLRYVDIGGTDAGLRLIETGRAIARYDSRDGYDAHPREDRYVTADEETPQDPC